MLSSPRLTPRNRLALLMHGAVTNYHGKMGFGLMRYGVARTVVVIDRTQAGGDLAALTGIPCHAPIVASVREALAFGPDVLVPAVAPPGGRLPAEWRAEVKEALSAGLSLVNGLHDPLAKDAELAGLLAPDSFIWDIRQEPPGLDNGLGRAKDVRAKRVLLVGTDMANGKMTAALELDRAARARGLRSRFLATGQIGIAIAGEGVPLDAVRIDYATGAVEKMVLEHGDDDILFIEGQGSLLHPASTAAFALMRGAMPTQLILTHRAGQQSIARCPWVPIPPLADVARLYEQVSAAAGSLPGARVAGIALNCGHLSAAEADAACTEASAETGLPALDVLRHGCDSLLDMLLA